MARIDSFLRLVVEQRASDLHLRAGYVPFVRYVGELHPLPFRVLSQEEVMRLLGEIMRPEDEERFRSGQETDFAYSLPDDIGRFRAHVFHHSGGAGAVFRVVPKQIPGLDELRMPPILKSVARETSGLVLVTGPTGSGKTTTLAAFIHEINTTLRKHVITIEDPIEFVHEPIQSIITQRHVGIHSVSFAKALKSALREAPDVIVVGEMRDLETVQLALSAAETGALVFATLHTRNSARAIDRILDVCNEDSVEQVRNALAGSLRAVIAQCLCPRIAGDSLVPVVEVLLNGHAVAHMIRENKLHQLESWLKSPERRATGMQSLEVHAAELFDAGIISREDAARVTNTGDGQARTSLGTAAS